MSSVAPVLYIVLDHTIRPGSLDSSFSSTDGLELRSVDTHRSASFFPSIDRLFYVSAVCLLSVTAEAVSTVAPNFNSNHGDCWIYSKIRTSIYSPLTGSDIMADKAVGAEASVAI